MKSKKVIIAGIFCIVVFMAKAPLISQSAQNTASFGLFTDTYDWYIDELDWQKANPETFALYGGIASNEFQFGFSVNVFDIYIAGSYEGLITAYGYGGSTMTDETFNLLIGYDAWSVRMSYFDQNYQYGRGTAMPSVFVAGAFPLANGVFKVNTGVDLALKFSSGMILDLIQPSMMIGCAYDHSIFSQSSLSYTIMPTFPGDKNTTDVALIPIFHRIAGTYSHTWALAEALSLAIGFNASIDINVNRTEGFYIIQGSLPGALIYHVIPNKLDIQTALLLGMYFANFNYPPEFGVGNNEKGCVPITGLAFGLTLHMGDHALLQVAAQFERIPYLASGTLHGYAAENISIANLLNAPISVSIQLRY